MMTKNQNNVRTARPMTGKRLCLAARTALLALLCAATCLLSACTTNSVEGPSEGSKTIAFQVTNYIQQEFGEGTRATPASSSSALQHLVLGIFDASTNRMVGSMQVQDRGDEGYGSFTATLPYGRYWLVFLGYSGDRACTMESPERVYFAGNYVPQTFLCARELEVNAQTAAQSDIILRRAVSGFQLQIEDAIPTAASTFLCKAMGGGNVLNAKTGLATTVTGKESVLDIPESAHGQSGKRITLYLFLTSNPERMDVEVSALDAQKEVLASRKFEGVPMKVNTLTVYKGRFFSGLPYGFGVSVEEEWGETEENTF